MEFTIVLEDGQKCQPLDKHWPWLAQNAPRARIWAADTFENNLISLLAPKDTWPGLAAHTAAQVSLKQTGEAILLEWFSYQLDAKACYLGAPPMVTASEAAVLWPLVTDLLADLAHLYPLNHQQALLLCESPVSGFGALGAQSYSAFQVDWLKKLPSAWRRVWTEAQMLLYTHPVNLTRQARHEAPINGFWLWDEKSVTLDPQAPQKPEQVWGEGLLLEALCCLNRLDYQAIQPDFATCQRISRGRQLLVWPRTLGLTDLSTQYLLPAWHALKWGQLRRLSLYGAGTLWRWQRFAPWAFWSAR